MSLTVDDNGALVEDGSVVTEPVSGVVNEVIVEEGGIALVKVTVTVVETGVMSTVGKKGSSMLSLSSS